MKRERKYTSRKRKTDLTKRLAGYSLAASAVLACGNQAGADIIYKNNLSIDFGAQNPYALTMEGTHSEAVFSGTNTTSTLSFHINGNNSINPLKVFASTSDDILQKLSLGQTIGAGSIIPNEGFGYFSVSNNAGQWAHDGDIGYFGFSFNPETDNTKTYYGWAQVKRIGIAQGRLLGWAYEDNGGSIRAGVVPIPSSLALLALGLGSAGTLLNRKKKKEA